MSTSATLLVLALFVAIASCFTTTEYQHEFTNWMQTHKKSYTVDEFQYRFNIFKGHMDYVSQWNSGNKETKLGMTVMADLTNEEYRRIYLGTKITKTPGVFPTTKNVNAPATVDWRQKGAVTPIKNQGQCGDCWAFSTTGSVEGVHKINTGNLVSLSEQNLCDCSGSYGNNGCNGGLMDYAFKYIINNPGVDTESSYPYQGVQGQCRFSSSNVGATISSYTDVQSGSENGLQTAVAQQPVSVAIDASHESFQLYSSGVYYEPACSTTQLDHGVLAIGYGTSGSQDYWLVKNSWGTTWGIQGYIMMSRNRNNNCGIATSASYPTGNGSSGSSNSNSNNNNNAASSTYNAVGLNFQKLGGRGSVNKDQTAKFDF